MAPTTPDQLAQELREAGYEGLFQSGPRDAAPAAWDGGGNREALEAVVRSDDFGDLERVLAAEVLGRCAPDFPPEGWEETLGRVYARALALTGQGELTANDWGRLFQAQANGEPDGPLGAHLQAAGPAAVPHLAELLDDASPILYIGSREATLGPPGYRVKDAAAYFISRIRGAEMAYPSAPAERDAAIDRLRDEVTRDG
jgi:hypothetical protein